MPNHFHAILEIVGSDYNNGNYRTGNPCGCPIFGQPQGIAPTDIPTDILTEITIKKTLGDMMAVFESITTVEYIRGVKQNGWQRFDGKLWKRNYWEHIIRNEPTYQNISQYIIDIS